ncbi:protein Mdm4-like [Protopterus annectens]|uniref:protein Mdm4-like n=1 Tax=Protopterus annectens TaxID=7888 RepID=UPI001CFC2EB1|nr:protein Mdm4-like [Protopterus annectens]
MVEMGKETILVTKLSKAGLYSESASTSSIRGAGGSYFAAAAAHFALGCWKCTTCKKFNSPEKRYCFRCWALRKDWYSDCPNFLHSTSTANVAATKGRKKEEDGGIDVPECRRAVSNPVNQTADQNELLEKNQTGPHSSTEPLVLTQCNPPAAFSSSSKPSLELPAALPESNKKLLKPCCMNIGNIIHGKTAHLVTCFLCARMLQKFNSPCPVYRQKINFVIKVFVA